MFVCTLRQLPKHILLSYKVPYSPHFHPFVVTHSVSPLPSIAMDVCKGSCPRYGELMYITANLLRPYGVHVLHPDYKVKSLSLFLTTTQVFC